MKTIILLFALCALSFSASGQFRYSPTVFANGFVQTVNNQAQAATYLGFPSLTGNNTWTGTNTFPAASFYRANNIGWRLLYSNPTNINVTSTAVAAVGSITNNGDFVNCTQLLTLTMPALVGSNSSVVMIRMVETPAQVTGVNAAFYVGPNTNFLGASVTEFTSTSAGRVGGAGVFREIMSNAGAFGTNLQGAALSVQSIFGPSNYVNTASSWTLYVGAYTTTGATNYNIRHLNFYEVFAD